MWPRYTTIMFYIVEGSTILINTQSLGSRWAHSLSSLAACETSPCSLMGLRDRQMSVGCTTWKRFTEDVLVVPEMRNYQVHRRRGTARQPLHKAGKWMEKLRKSKLSDWQSAQVRGEIFNLFEKWFKFVWNFFFCLCPKFRLNDVRRKDSRCFEENLFCNSLFDDWIPKSSRFLFEVILDQ